MAVWYMLLYVFRGCCLRSCLLNNSSSVVIEVDGAFVRNASVYSLVDLLSATDTKRQQPPSPSVQFIASNLTQGGDYVIMQ